MPNRKRKNVDDIILVLAVIFVLTLCCTFLSQLGFIRRYIFKAAPSVMEAMGVPNLPDKLIERYAVEGQLDIGCTYVIYPKGGIPTNYKNLGMWISGSKDAVLSLTSEVDLTPAYAALNAKNDPLYNGYEYIFFESASGKVWVLRPRKFQAHPENFVCPK